MTGRDYGDDVNDGEWTPEQLTYNPGAFLTPGREETPTYDLYGSQESKDEYNDYFRSRKDSGDNSNWQQNAYDSILDELEDVYELYGWDKYAADNFLGQHWGSIQPNIEYWLLNQPEAIQVRDGFLAEGGHAPSGYEILRSAGGWQRLMDQVRQQLIMANPNLSGLLGNKNLGPSRPGGGGRSGPSAEDIRNSYDIDQLSDQINEMSRGLLLEENPNARAMASSYVDVMVKSRRQKKVDFATFVRSEIEETDRYKSIYANKPDHLAAEEYMTPYITAAHQMARPNAAPSIAIGGAQFGASGSQFAARLQRTNSNVTSSRFVNELEGRLTSLKDVFKG